jgi:ppGpp synthetase/RelA/SpoT-type nucleotidyltranferase
VVDQGNVHDADAVTSDETEAVNAAAHEARLKYETELGLYEDFARSVASILERCLEEKHIKSQSISYRAKDPDEFERKAARPVPGSITAKYSDPLTQITDKAGVRVITYFLHNVDEIDEFIPDEFEVIERTLKASDEPDRFGYRSLHFLVKYLNSRTQLTEYRRFNGLMAEIQVRTVLQHAWAEIEHDIRYKSPSLLPDAVSRRFGSLAGLIEIADREFQAIEDENRAIREDARRNLREGRLDVIEITPDSLQAYLDMKYGADGRMREWSYEWEAKFLRRLGFTNLAQVDECIRGSDDDLISRIIYGSRLGQLARFEVVLLASMGENLLRAHPWARDSDWREYMLGDIRKLEKMRSEFEKYRSTGVSVGNYRPPAFPDDALSPAEFEVMKQELSGDRPPDLAQES